MKVSENALKALGKAWIQNFSSVLYNAEERGINLKAIHCYSLLSDGKKDKRYVSWTTIILLKEYSSIDVNVLMRDLNE